MNARDASVNARWQRWSDWGRINRRTPEFIKERDLTLLGNKVGSLGNKGSSTIALIAVRRQIDKHCLLLMWDSVYKGKIWKKRHCLLSVWG